MIDNNFVLDVFPFHISVPITASNWSNRIIASSYYLFYAYRNSIIAITLNAHSHAHTVCIQFKTNIRDFSLWEQSGQFLRESNLPQYSIIAAVDVAGNVYKVCIFNSPAQATVIQANSPDSLIYHLPGIHKINIEDEKCLRFVVENEIHIVLFDETQEHSVHKINMHSGPITHLSSDIVGCQNGDVYQLVEKNLTFLFNIGSKVVDILVGSESILGACSLKIPNNQIPIFLPLDNIKACIYHLKAYYFVTDDGKLFRSTTLSNFECLALSDVYQIAVVDSKLFAIFTDGSVGRFTNMPILLNQSVTDLQDEVVSLKNKVIAYEKENERLEKSLKADYFEFIQKLRSSEYFLKTSIELRTDDEEWNGQSVVTVKIKNDSDRQLHGDTYKIIISVLPSALEDGQVTSLTNTKQFSFEVAPGGTWKRSILTSVTSCLISVYLCFGSFSIPLRKLLT